MFMALATWPLSKSGTVMLAKPSATDPRELIQLDELGKLRVTISRGFSMNRVAACASSHRGRLRTRKGHTSESLMRG